MANNNWNNYTEKNAALTDKDEIMLRDSTDGKNKRSPLSKIWNYMVDKMATAVISKLETDNKTIIGAINYLYGNTGKYIFSGVKNKGTLYYPIEDYSFMLVVLQTSTISNTPVYIVSRYHTDICIQLLAGGRDDTKASIENEKLVVTLGFSTYVSIYSF
ncbi:hypothetical protein GPK86_03890 [Blautia faecis]|uniref:hypothetical protein n=1 Tax=Blautia faecis TaxID=871665 RepID=UPI001C027569|nr:hypothetical protein [Blautia faecis]MBT9855618.1 hypothetical protein [Blautia faecis]